MKRVFELRDFTTTNWSGGQTTELFIYPPESEVARRNFQLRISTATVETPHSVFTPFIGFERQICLLEGSLLIRHNKSQSLKLDPGTTHTFSGDWATEAEGMVRDFNVIYRHSLAVQTTPLTLEAGEHTLDTGSSTFLYLIEGNVKANEIQLVAGQLLVTDMKRLNVKTEALSSIILVRTDLNMTGE